MDADDVRQLAGQGEGQQLEFKRSLAELGTATRTVTAFANIDCGLLLFGVRDSGAIIGVEVGQIIRERIVNRTIDTPGPVVYPSVEYVRVKEPVVIVVCTAPSDNRPHLAEGRAYKRCKPSSITLEDDTRVMKEGLVQAVFRCRVSAIFVPYAMGAVQRA